MASCGNCRRLELRTGSLIFGYILLVLKILWIYVRVAKIMDLVPYYMQTITSCYKVADILYLVLLLIQVSILVPIIAGLSKKYFHLLYFYKAYMIYYVFECIFFVFISWFCGLNLKDAYIGIAFSSDFLLIVLGLCFSLLVRRYYLQHKETVTYDLIKDIVGDRKEENGFKKHTIVFSV